jgi:NAD(P)-dependent dehydrogenase (short-subunit alcohol dehydrogenase family)
MDEAEWDMVIAVHLKGHFAPAKHAAAHWRERTKAGEQVRARVINTSSPTGMFANVGQSNYGPAAGRCGAADDDRDAGEGRRDLHAQVMTIIEPEIGIVHLAA